MAELTGRFDKALMYASALSRLILPDSARQRSIPLALCTAALVLEAGGGDDEAIAALLLEVAASEHGEAVLRDIRRMFGEDVHALIGGCLASDYRILQISGGDVREFSLKLAGQLGEGLRLALADSMAKVAVIHAQLMVEGARAIGRSDSHSLLEHYDLLARTFLLLWPSMLAERFSFVVAELRALASPYAEGGSPAAAVEPFRPRIVTDD